MGLSFEIKRGTLCSLDSLEADEEMYGTATTVETWLVLEYHGRWSGDAFRDSRIPDYVKASINRYLETLPNPRLQLIKKPEQGSDGIKLFIVRSGENNASLSEITLGGYEELLDYSMDSLIRNKASERAEPLFLICTNGEHDQCCGKFGMPVYLETAAGTYGGNTWQSTHIGGHRFASTLVCLPHGLCYGRVREGAKAEEIFTEYTNGRIALGSYRGRSCYSPPVQAAEYFLRRETGVREISAYYLKDVTENDGTINVEFFVSGSENIFRVNLRRLDNALRALKSCGDGERSFTQQFILIRIQES